MVTVGAAYNVDPHYPNRLFQPAHRQSLAAAESTPISEGSLSCDMAYRFVPNPSLINAPSYNRKLAGSDEHLNRNHSLATQPVNFEENNRFSPLKSGFQLAGVNPNFLPGVVTQGQSNDFLDDDRNNFNSKSPSSSSTERRYSDGGSLQNNSMVVSAQQRFFDDDEDDSWKICGVCNDKATGYHFNALTCEGCKGFFRRSMKNSKNFTCSYSNQCNITKNNRRQCQACRLRKCLEIGMKKECIMSRDQIQLKKTLVLTNRIKRTAQQWQPMPFNDDQKTLLDIICTAFIQSNSPPDQKVLRGAQELKQDTVKQLPDSPCSVGSSNSSTFLDLIKRISKEITERTPSNMISQAHVLHFTDIMEFSIKEVIKFCKKIPTFMDLNLKDQIALLKAGCTEILFIKANYTYDHSRKALTLGPDIIYTRESFLQGGMSEHYTDAYLKFHEDLSILNLNDMEMSALSAIALFSADRTDVVDTRAVDDQQEVIALALQAYTESLYRVRNRFATIMSFLPKLRTLNALCSHAFAEVHKQYKEEIRPLVAEVQPDSSVS